MTTSGTHDPMHNPPSRTPLACRTGCGACCIAPSISSPIPGMPGGKPAGVRCIQLDDTYRCRLFGDPRRPPVCCNLQPEAEMCGLSRTHALRYLANLEIATTSRPGASKNATSG